MQLFIYFYFDRIVCDLLILMPFWLVCILHMELSFLVCVVNEFCVYLIKLQFYNLAMSYAKQTNNNGYNYELLK
jgi:hypothetical protein